MNLLPNLLGKAYAKSEKLPPPLIDKSIISPREFSIQRRRWSTIGTELKTKKERKFVRSFSVGDIDAHSSLNTEFVDKLYKDSKVENDDKQQIKSCPKSWPISEMTHAKMLIEGQPVLMHKQRIGLIKFPSYGATIRSSRNLKYFIFSKFKNQSTHEAHPEVRKGKVWNSNDLVDVFPGLYLFPIEESHSLKADEEKCLTLLMKNSIHIYIEFISSDKQIAQRWYDALMWLRNKTMSLANILPVSYNKIVHKTTFDSPHMIHSTMLKRGQFFNHYKLSKIKQKRVCHISWSEDLDVVNLLSFSDTNSVTYKKRTCFRTSMMHEVATGIKCPLYGVYKWCFTLKFAANKGIYQVNICAGSDKEAQSWIKAIEWVRSMRNDNIGSPYNVTKNRLMDINMNWTGNKDDIFTLQELLGEGRFGSVYKATLHALNNMTVAVKLVPIFGDDIHVDSLIQKEINILERCQHENTLKYLGAVKDNNVMYILMEYCDSGTLEQLIKKRTEVMREEHIAYIIKSLLLALDYLHSRHIVHRDVKPANALLTANGVVKLSDFGISEQLPVISAKKKHTDEEKVCGSPLYMAPEAFHGVANSGVKSDIWSVGITAIELAQGFQPYYDAGKKMTFYDLYELVTTQPSPKLPMKPLSLSSDIQNWSEEFSHFVDCCLIKNPLKRWSAKKLLRHPFLHDLIMDRNKENVGLPSFLIYLQDGCYTNSPGVTSASRKLRAKRHFQFQQAESKLTLSGKISRLLSRSRSANQPTHNHNNDDEQSLYNDSDSNSIHSTIESTFSKFMNKFKRSSTRVINNNQNKANSILSNNTTVTSDSDHANNYKLLRGSTDTDLSRSFSSTNIKSTVTKHKRRKSSPTTKAEWDQVYNSYMEIELHAPQNNKINTTHETKRICKAQTYQSLANVERDINASMRLVPMNDLIVMAPESIMSVERDVTKWYIKQRHKRRLSGGFDSNPSSDNLDTSSVRDIINNDETKIKSRPRSRSDDNSDEIDFSALQLTVGEKESFEGEDIHLEYNADMLDEHKMEWLQVHSDIDETEDIHFTYTECFNTSSDDTDCEDASYRNRRRNRIQSFPCDDDSILSDSNASPISQPVTSSSSQQMSPALLLSPLASPELRNEALIATPRRQVRTLSAETRTKFQVEQRTDKQVYDSMQQTLNMKQRISSHGKLSQLEKHKNNNNDNNNDNKSDGIKFQPDDTYKIESGSFLSQGIEVNSYGMKFNKPSSLLSRSNSNTSSNNSSNSSKLNLLNTDSPSISHHCSPASVRLAKKIKKKSLTETTLNNTTGNDNDNDDNYDEAGSVEHMINGRDLVFVQPLGSGQSGNVFQAFHFPSLSFMAVKSMHVFEQSSRRQLVQELRTLSCLGDDNLIYFIGAFFDSGKIHVVMEHMSIGSLTDLVNVHGALSERLIRHIIKRVLIGLKYLHSKSIVHRDIKPENILINHYGKVKISDFGLAKKLSSNLNLANTYLGTMVYLSPERIQAKSYSYESDIWSLGVTALYLAQGNLNSIGHTYWEVLASLSKVDKTYLENPELYSPELCDFVHICLQHDPTNRLSASELLLHPFITGIHNNKMTINESQMNDNNHWPFELKFTRKKKEPHIILAIIRRIVQDRFMLEDDSCRERVLQDQVMIQHLSNLFQMQVSEVEKMFDLYLS